MVDVFDEILDGGKSSKLLLRLVIKHKSISVTQAESIIKVPRNTIIEWVNQLLEKGYVKISSNATDMIIEPSQKIISKIENRSISKPDSIQVAKNKSAKKIQDPGERIQHELEKKSAIIDDLRDQLLVEKKTIARLKDQLNDVKDRVRTEIYEKVGDLKERLEREHNERIKLENIIRAQKGEQAIEITPLFSIEDEKRLREIDLDLSDIPKRDEKPEGMEPTSSKDETPLVGQEVTQTPDKKGVISPSSDEDMEFAENLAEQAFEKGFEAEVRDKEVSEKSEEKPMEKIADKNEKSQEAESDELDNDPIVKSVNYINKEKKAKVSEFALFMGIGQEEMDKLIRQLIQLGAAKIKTHMFSEPEVIYIEVFNFKQYIDEKRKAAYKEQVKKERDN